MDRSLVCIPFYTHLPAKSLPTRFILAPLGVFWLRMVSAVFPLALAPRVPKLQSIGGPLVPSGAEI